MNIVCESSDPYASLITTLVAKEFPSHSCGNRDLMLDLVSAEIISTKQNRCGCQPSPEVQVNIRNIIRAYMKENRPIPIHVVWGSEKPDGSGIDVAELSALKMLRCLQHRVEAHYYPGLDIRIRIEDVSAPHLFYDSMEEARKNANMYSTALIDLAYILETEHYISLVRETSLVSEQEFNKRADEVLPVMQEYLLGVRTPSVLAQLEKVGWKGDLPEKTREFYLRQYTKIYPGKTHEDLVHRLARYFAGTIVRRQLGISGARDRWNYDYVELAFIAGAPGSDFGKRVFYRTMPLAQTNLHLAPWRGKGYVRVGETLEDTHMGLIPFDSPIVNDLQPFTFAMEREDKQVLVNADYTLV